MSGAPRPFSGACGMTLARYQDEHGTSWRFRDTDWGVVLDKKTPNSTRWRWVMDVASEPSDLGRDRTEHEQKLKQTVAIISGRAQRGR